MELPRYNNNTGAAPKSPSSPAKAGMDFIVGSLMPQRRLHDWDADDHKYTKHTRGGRMYGRLLSLVNGSPPVLSFVIFFILLILFVRWSWYTPNEPSAVEAVVVAESTPSDIIPDVPMIPVPAKDPVEDRKADVKKTSTKVVPANFRKQAVIQAFRHAWDGYEKYAWGRDVLKPISKTGEDWFSMGLTIIDAVDTAYLMGLDDIVAKARKWISTDLKFTGGGNSNVFEVTIRVLGGLLTMFHFSNDKLYLDKAVELADKMRPAFETASGIPVDSINFATGNAVAGDPFSSTAEATTLQLEWRYLSVLTNNTDYWMIAEKAMTRALAPSTMRADGIVPIFISPATGDFHGLNYRLGSRGDSYYEYLGKQWLQTAGSEPEFATQFERAIDGIMKHLVQQTATNNLIFVGEWQNGAMNQLTPKMDHLVCFLPGTIAAYISRGKSLTTSSQIAKLSPKHQEYLTFAEQLTRTCYQMYGTPTGLAPEIAYFITATDESHTTDFTISPSDAHNLLRPETVESLYYMSKITGQEFYRDWAWEIFQAFEKYSKVADAGYTSLKDVTTIPPEPRDKMESFFLGETLKYFYLIFEENDESKIDLSKYVFNTEAHPFPIMKDLDPAFLQELKNRGSAQLVT